MSTAADMPRRAFQAAIDAVDAENCLPPHLPAPPDNGRLIVLAAGKATSSLVRAAEAHYARQGVRVTGLGVTRRGFLLPTTMIELMVAGHPLPDADSVVAASRALEIAQSATEDDTVLVLLSGGASALWTAPVEGLSLECKQAVTRRLLASGAPISELNCVRKHLSRIKGGRLTQAAHPARVITLAISDVPKDDPATIGSGPTVGDPTSLSDAFEILRRRRVTIDEKLEKVLHNPDNESPAPGSAVFAEATYRIIARPADALEGAASLLRNSGFEVRMLGDSIEGEARDVAKEHAELALSSLQKGERVAYLSGGELTVTVEGEGKGGPNQEYALALAIALNGKPGISALAADTDGADGGAGAVDDPAGALVYPTTLARARKHGLDPVTFLENNDSTAFFSALDDLLITGPTHTNVNDFRVILVEP